MALRATVYKAELQVSDLDRHYYQTHSLTVARHPSETDERMMVRLLAFTLNASESLSFGRGISTDDEPALWDRDLTGAVKTWIEVGLPDERLLRRAAGRAEQVLLYAYGGRSLPPWWASNAAALARCANLKVFELKAEECASLTQLATRNMRLQATVQDGTVWIGGESGEAQITPHVLQPA